MDATTLLPNRFIRYVRCVLSPYDYIGGDRGQKALCPLSQEYLKSVNWGHIDRAEKDYFALGVTKIVEAAGLYLKTDTEYS